MKNSFSLILAAILASCTLAFPVSAQMNGITMEGEWHMPALGQVSYAPPSFVVGAGIELPFGSWNDPLVETDLDADIIELRFNHQSGTAYLPFGVNGPLFRDVHGTLPQIVGFSVIGSSAGISIPPQGLTTGFTDDECWINLAGMGHGGPGSWLRCQVQFAGSSPTLGISGSCGQSGSGLQANGMTPGGQVAFAWSTTASPSGLAAGPCAGTTIGLVGPRLAGVRTADPFGTVLVSPPGGIPAAGCGTIHVQALDVATCGVTNVVSL